MKDKANSYLIKKPMLHMGMIEPIRKNTAQVLYAEIDGVLMKELKSNAYMISVDDFDKGRELIELISECNLILVHQEFMVDYIADKFKLVEQLDCIQVVYTSKNKLKVNEELEVRLLKLEHLETVLEHYDKLPKTEIIELIKSESLYGGYKDGVLVGFVGNHLEGSMGLLEIFPAYRRKGYATALESHLVNQLLYKGLVPFGQVLYNNENSIALHKKLGFEISKERLYWVFN